MAVKLLVVDDDDTICDLVVNACDLIGIEAGKESNPLSLSKSHVNDYLLWFLDLNMPERDGIEVIRWLAENKYKGMLVLMSGFDRSVLLSAERLAQAHHLNIVGHIEKPFSLRNVQLLIEEAVEDFEPQILDKPHSNPRLELSPYAIEELIAQNRIVVHYQPQVELATGRLIGFEALVRLKTMAGELVMPNDFIELAEKQGLIQALTRSVVCEALSGFEKMLKKFAKLTLSINLSALDLEDKGLANWLEEQVNQYQIMHSKVIFEVTESKEIFAITDALDILNRLRLKGFNLSLDDYGTGSAVLSQVHHLPLTELKIDRAFVKNVLFDEKSQVLIKNVISMCKDLRLDVVCEGIENQQTADLLVGYGAKIGQGYLYAKPMSVDDALELIEGHQQNMSLDSVCLTSGDESNIPHQISLKPADLDGQEAVAFYEQSVLSNKPNPKSFLSYSLPLTGNFSFIGISEKYGAILAYLELFANQGQTDIGLEFFDDASELAQLKENLTQRVSVNSLGSVGATFPFQHSEEFVEFASTLKTPILAPFNGCKALRVETVDNVYNIKAGIEQELMAIAKKFNASGQRSIMVHAPVSLKQNPVEFFKQISHVEIIEFLPQNAEETLKKIKEIRPINVMFFGSAKSLLQMVEALENEEINFYSTSLIGFGTLKKLLIRKPKVKVWVTSTIPDYQGNDHTATEFRKVAQKYNCPVKYINSICYDMYLSTKFLLETYVSSHQDRGDIESRVEGFERALKNTFGFDLGMECPLSWNPQNRSFSNAVYFININEY
ncbi:hypothetical protein THMIRHAM_02710 [Thiomicrorhabdus immobilis]|uniref:EAL domain-containing protein n=1 Tax=Thiomicrorhabdus immobilis TaxID=2791037 RepID=A0ABN6CU67_9GAMM|nr:EAL domain-containing protein [Thiomicrorhabdus immobilis]BCN92486.1 hypothetical protein THMIRHAM_02710 [Thiomicrorhabdus immobilis]